MSNGANSVHKQLRSELETDLYEKYLNAINAIINKYGTERIHKDS